MSLPSTFPTLTGLSLLRSTSALAERLYRLGWDSPTDAQHGRLDALRSEMLAELEAIEEQSRLRWEQMQRDERAVDKAHEALDGLKAHVAVGLAAKDAEIQELRKAVDAAHETLDKSGRLQRRDISHLGLRARIEVLLDILNDMAGERDRQKQRADQEETAAARYAKSLNETRKAGHALADQFAKHDGCSRWGVADMVAMRDWRRATDDDRFDRVTS